MTLRMHARFAGTLFLLYIAAGIANMVLSRRATAGSDAAARLATMATHEGMVRGSVLLTLLTSAIALALGASLWALTRRAGEDLALMGLTFRISEGVVGAVSSVRMLGLLSLATASAGATGADAASVAALGGMLLRQGGWTGLVAATSFAIGSTIFAWLFLRGRSIPGWLAWLGLVASLLLVIALPLQLGGLIRGVITYLIWLPMFFFEVILAFWLIVRGIDETPFPTAVNA